VEGLPLSRKSWVWCKKEERLVPREEYQAGAQVHVIEDSMDSLRHPVTGEMIDSKSQFERVTRQNGCVTVGSFTPKQRIKPKPDPELRREHIAQAQKDIRDRWHDPDFRAKVYIDRKRLLGF
jgi:hypothetical protein